MITEDYVSFETAKLLKEKGFDGKSCVLYYNEFGEIMPIKHISSYIECPTQQMARKWLRRTHNVNIDIVPIWNQKRFEYQVFVVTPENAKHCYVDDKLYLGYEEACETAIKYCLENLI